MSGTGGNDGDANWGSPGDSGGSRASGSGDSSGGQWPPPADQDPWGGRYSTGGGQAGGAQGQSSDPWGPPPEPGQQWQAPPYAAGEPVPNYLVWSILSTIFCCQFAGIPAIVFAAQAKGKQSGGDIAGAMEDARKARTWCIVATSLGGVILLGYIAVVFGGFMNAMGPTAG